MRSTERHTIKPIPEDAPWVYSHEQVGELRSALARQDLSEIHLWPEEAHKDFWTGYLKSVSPKVLATALRFPWFFSDLSREERKVWGENPRVYFGAKPILALHEDENGVRPNEYNLFARQHIFVAKLAKDIRQRIISPVNSSLTSEEYQDEASRIIRMLEECNLDALRKARITRWDQWKHFPSEEKVLYATWNNPFDTQTLRILPIYARITNRSLAEVVDEFKVWLIEDMLASGHFFTHLYRTEWSA